MILLEDTRGLHKGMPLVRDHRLMLQFEYAQSMFGHPAGLSTADLDPIDDALLERDAREVPAGLLACWTADAPLSRRARALAPAGDLARRGARRQPDRALPRPRHPPCAVGDR